MFGCARLSQGKIPLILTACWTGCAFLQNLGLSPGIPANIPPHRVARLKRQGERYFADGLSDLSDNRRLSILAVCAVEWPADIADAIIETHDRIVGKTWREAKRLCDARVDDAKAAVRQTLRSFAELGSALLEAQGDKAELEPAISDNFGWEGLQNLVATAARLTDTMSADPLTCIFRDIRPPIPTTSAHLYRGIRPALTRCREALVFDISFLAFRHVVEGLSFGRIVRRVRAGRRCAPAGLGWHLRRWVHQ